MRALCLALALTALVGCGSRLSGYNLKATVGHTDSGGRSSSVYTEAGIDAHFDVLPSRSNLR